MKPSRIVMRYALTFVLILVLVGCGNQAGTNSFNDAQNDLEIRLPEHLEEKYEYASTGRVYACPAMIPVERRVEFLWLSIEDGVFFCDTTNTEQADSFINSQRTLLL